jgi:flagellar motor switch protein FliN/FliY
MAEFDPSIADAVLAACRAGAGEASGALGRTLDTTLELAVGEATTYDAAALADELNGPGLAILQIVGKLGAVALLSEATGLLPAWYGQPDATGTSKLATMAQELGMLLLPEEFMPDDFRAARVPHLAQALDRGGFAAGTALVKLPITAGEKQATLYLLWPGSAPGELFNAPPEAAPAAAPPVEAKVAPAAPVEKPAAVEAPKPVSAPPAFAAEDRLNPYTRSLLRIPVPVIVTLAKKKQPLKKIVDLRPGSIIQFDKSCEEMLELEVNNQVVAEGECVKAGDKFGLRVTSIRPPDERFKTVRR